MAICPNFLKIFTNYSCNTSKCSSAIISIAIFLLLFISLNIVLYNAPNSYLTKARSATTKQNKIKILITGSSHEILSIQTECLPSPSLNLANISQTIGLDYELIKHYLPKMTNLKVLILGISYHTLDFSFHGKPNESWRDRFARIYYGICEADLFSQISDPGYFVPSFIMGNRNILNYLLHQKNDLLNCESDGSLKGNWQGDLSQNYAKERLNLHHSQMQAKASRTNLQKIEEILSFCQKKNIKVIFVISPVSSTYANEINKHYWNSLQDIILALCLKYQCQIANYLQDSRFNSKDFADVDHLNYSGAKKFSKILSNEYILPSLNCN